MKIRKHYLFISLIFLVLSSCNKFEDSTEYTFLTDGTWRIIMEERYIVDGFYAPSRRIKNFDDGPFYTLEFHEDYSVIYVNPYREPLEGKWKVKDNVIRTDLETSVPYYFGGGAYISKKLYPNEEILELSDKKLVIKSEVKTEKVSWDNEEKFYNIVTLGKE